MRNKVDCPGYYFIQGKIGGALEQWKIWGLADLYLVAKHYPVTKRLSRAAGASDI